MNVMTLKALGDWLAQKLADRKHRNRIHRLECLDSEIFNRYSKFPHKEDFLWVLVRFLINTASERECEVISNMFGRHAHFKSRCKTRRQETNEVDLIQEQQKLYDFGGNC